MRRLLMLGLLVSSTAAVGCNITTGRCDCTYDEAAASQGPSGPSYPVVNHGSPMGAPVVPAPAVATPSIPEKMPTPMKEPAKDLPKLPPLPEKSN